MAAAGECTDMPSHRRLSFPYAGWGAGECCSQNCPLCQRTVLEYSGLRRKTLPTHPSAGPGGFQFIIPVVPEEVTGGAAGAGPALLAPWSWSCCLLTSPARPCCPAWALGMLAAVPGACPPTHSENSGLCEVHQQTEPLLPRPAGFVTRQVPYSTTCWGLTEVECVA